MIVAGNKDGRFSDLGPAEGLLHVPRSERVDSPFDHQVFSVAPSIVLVNVEKGVYLRTDLIVEDCLLEIFEKLEYIFTVLNALSSLA